MADKKRLAGRRGARYGAVQAVYRWLMNEVPVAKLLLELRDWEHLAAANAAMLQELLEGVLSQHAHLDELLAAQLDRPLAQLDPMEHAVLLVGAYELAESPHLSRRIVINEAIELAKLFGASDGHKYVNGVLDRLARELRPHEV